MKLTKEQIGRIIELILTRLKEKELVLFKADEEKVASKMQEVFIADLKAEDNLDREVEQILSTHSAAIDSQRLDYRKMLHLVFDGVWKDDLVDFTDDDKALKEIKRVLTGFLKVEDEADSAARNKIRSLSRDVPEGSREWDVLYKKYFEEEMAKKRF
jgi:hypothetical protein